MSGGESVDSDSLSALRPTDLTTLRYFYLALALYGLATVIWVAAVLGWNSVIAAGLLLTPLGTQR
jgi:hypothetical protein